MRQPFPRTLSVLSMSLMLIISISSRGQDQNSKKPPPSSGQAAPESDLLAADEGPALTISASILKEFMASGIWAIPDTGDPPPAQKPSFRANSRPREGHLRRGRSFHGDLRTLPQTPPRKFERPERNEPKATRTLLPRTQTSNSTQAAPVQSTPSGPAPAPGNSFEGLDFANWGAGHPPDPNGDVGPTYYIQTINTSVGVYRKSDSVRVVAFTFNTLMSQGNFGNLCDTNNFGDPVVLYDTFEDRWIITDLAFQLDGWNNVVNPPGAFECFAVSKTGDPVSGGWNFFSINVSGGLGDYPKLGIWPDGLYMSANMFGYPSGAAFQNPRVWALNKTQMYANAPSVQVVTFDAPTADFAILPSNARLQTGTPPPGTPNYFLATWEFLNAVTVYRFHVNWDSPLLSTFTGPDAPTAATSWPNANVSNAPSQGGNALDVLQIRAMVQNQYTNLGGVESLWVAHTVRRGNTSGFAAPRYYQVNVTGGTVAASITQAATWDPDAANVMYRFMPSVAVDRAGDMALGYSTSSSTTFPAIMYAGRLATDPVNTLTQTEQVLIQGSGTQTGSCGGTCTRWGDYGAMTLDPDGCTFWFTSMYYVTSGLSFNTRIGSFTFPSCTPVGAGGTVQGTVTAGVGDAPVSGVTVALGSRTVATDSNGNYTFSGIPAGTYPSITASGPGYASVTVPSIGVTDDAITTQDFSLTLAAASACLTDTTQADFQAGAITNCDLTGSPGDITLLSGSPIDQQSIALGTSGVGITITTWGGQAFTPAVTGLLTRIDVNLFCSGCTGTTPNLTLSLRATSAGLPTGADLASATITGFGNGGVASYFTANFSSPVTLTAGTQYALVIRPTANPSPGTYALTRSGTSTVGADVYAGGTRVSGATSGTVWSKPTTGGITTDAGFKTYINAGFASSGTFTSSIKDANPDPLSVAQWGTISWTADTPAGTDVQFQVAGSSNPAGPFSFVGPDGTVATFFTNPGSLARFNGNRYLKYQASFTSNSGAITATLHDVTICFSDVVPAVATVLAADPATAAFGGTANLSATLTASATGVGGKTLSFTLNGNSAGDGTTDGSGVATVPNASLTGINPGSYPSGVAATFAGDSGYIASAGAAALTVSLADQTITFDVLADKTFGDLDFAVSATVSSSLGVTFAATGDCSVAGSTVHLTGAGACTITASQAGNSNYNPASDFPQSLTINKAAPLLTLSCPPAGFDNNTHACSASVTGIGNVIVSGPTTVTYDSSPAPPGNAGTYAVIASFTSSDSNYSDATGTDSLVIAKVTPTVTVACPAGVVFSGSPQLCMASATGVGNSAVSGSVVITYSGGPAPSAGGTYAVSASFTSGNSNYTDDTGAGSLTIAKAGQTITFGVLAPKTYGDPDITISATSSSGLTVDFSASGNCSIAGSTIHLTSVGACTVTASQAGNTDYNPATGVPRSFAIIPEDDFTIATTLPTVTVRAGHPATVHMTITPIATTITALHFTCSGLPAKASCTFSPNPMPPGSAVTDVVVTITTTAPTTSALQRPPVIYAGWVGFTGMGLMGLVVVGVRRVSRKRVVILSGFSLIVLMMTMGCGALQTGAGAIGTPPGTSTVTMTGSTTGFTHSTTFTLTVN
jgi:hypothetical protein